MEYNKFCTCPKNERNEFHMMIVNTRSELVRETPVEMLPLRIRKYFFGIDCSDLTEIRLRCRSPLCVKTKTGIKFITHSGGLTNERSKGIIITKRDIDEAVDVLTASSLYTYKEEIKNGYITAPGGHRVGICGTVTPEGEFIRDISCLNYRFAREIYGAADRVVEAVFNNGNIKSTLIISRPGCGKTTFLRDLIRQISNKGVNISVIDERGELGAVRDGVPGFDLGSCSDILDMCNKSDGMNMVLRSMSPSVIAVDEFSPQAEGKILERAARAGVSVFATVHGSDWKKDIPPHILKCFSCVVVLTDKPYAGTVREIVHV